VTGPVRPPLEVTEVDGSPDGRPINKIVVSNGDLSVSGTTATIDTTGSGGTADLTASFIGFGSMSDLLTGDLKLTWKNDVGSEQLLIKGSNVSDTDGLVKIQATNQNSNSAPDIEFYHQRDNPTDSDMLGQLLWTGDKAAASGGASTGQQEYVTMWVRANDVKSGQEDGEFFFTQMLAGTQRTFFSSQSSGGSGYITFNDDGQDVDFRVECRSSVTAIDSVNALRLVGSTGYLGLGKAVPSAHLHIVGTDEGASSDVIIESSAALGTNPAPGLILWRNSVGVDEKWLGEIAFKGQDVDDDPHNYVELNSYITHPGTTGNPNVNGMLDLDVMKSGSLAQVARFRESGADFNTGENAGLDFRIRSGSNTDMFIVDAGTDHVGIGCIPSSDDSVVLEIKNTTDSAGGETKLRISNDNTSMPSDTAYATIEFYNADASGAGVGAEISALSNGSGRGGQLDFLVANSGDAHTSKMFIDEAGIVTIADTASTVHDNTLGRLQVNVGDSTQTALTLISTDAGADVSPTLDLYRHSGSPVDGDDIGKITFSGEDDGDAKQEWASISAELVDASAGSEDARLRFYATSYGGTAREYLRMGGQDIVFNEGSIDINTRFESSSNVNMLKIDGGLNRIGIGAAPVSPGARFQVDEDATFLRFIQENTATMDITPQMLHNSIQTLKSTVSRVYASLPDVADTVAGMCMTFVSVGGDMSIIGKTGEGQSINGVAASTTEPTVAFDTAYSRVELIALTTSMWTCWVNGAIATVTNT